MNEFLEGFGRFVGYAFLTALLCFGFVLVCAFFMVIASFALELLGVICGAVQETRMRKRATWNDE